MAMLKRQAFEYKIAMQGKIEATASSQVRSKQAGLIQKLYIRNGQQVRAGQILAELDRAELVLALEKARNQVAARKADYQDRLIRQRIDIQKEEELSPELRQGFRISSGLADAEIALREAELNLSYATLKSPIKGTVANVEIKTFPYISPDKPLCTVYSAAQLEVVGEVLESEVGQLTQGQRAIVQTVMGEKSYEAILQEINPLVNEKGLVKVRLKLLTSEGLLLGMNVQAQIIVPRRQTLVVPKEAVVIRSGKKVVFTAEKGLAKWNYVETGLENEQSVEVIKGLQAGQQVIVDNNLQLAHDAPVKVRDKP
ncbi:MAG: efflux RND transporter periplasmic adaptor subunit [Microscillaceae bacterium]|nr:efflux RND transporter periplasmic adaptor subunit [Microscillaceae bacterium]